MKEKITWKEIKSHLEILCDEDRCLNAFSFDFIVNKVFYRSKDFIDGLSTTELYAMFLDSLIKLVYDSLQKDKFRRIILIRSVFIVQKDIFLKANRVLYSSYELSEDEYNIVNNRLIEYSNIFEEEVKEMSRNYKLIKNK